MFGHATSGRRAECVARCQAIKKIHIRERTELTRSHTSQRQRVRAQDESRVSGCWQPFCQEKCVQNLVKFVDLLRMRVGKSACRPSSWWRRMLLCGGRRAEHANVQNFDDYILGPGRLRAGMHGHSWSELGSVETWPFRRHHFHPYLYPISRLRSCDDSILYGLFF